VIEIETKWVILDRDGTLCKKYHYLLDISDVEILPGVVEGLSLLSKNNYRFIVITNQSPVGRKLISLEQLDEINKYLIDLLLKHEIKIEKIYSCTHLPENYCDCRKPKIGLFQKAENDFRINKESSTLIGDSDSDILAGLNWGCKTIKIGSNFSNFIDCDYLAVDLLDAANYMLKNITETPNH